MEQEWDPDEEVPRAPRRGEYVPPPWFERDEASAQEDAGEAVPAKRLSRERILGALALALLIIWVPLEFVIDYRSRADALERVDMTLGFVWAVVIEALAVWGLIRVLTRR